MPLPVGWTPDSIANCSVIGWHGHAWRIHRHTYDATDSEGSRRVSGRYHRGLNDAPIDQVVPVLYLALNAETAIAELVRHITPELLPHLNGYRITELALTLSAVVDCGDPSCADLLVADLCDDIDYDAPRALARAASHTKAEGLLVPSATRLGNNLILFPSNLGDTSSISVVTSRDPRLFIPRD